MDLDTPESAEMAEQVLKKFWQECFYKEVAEQKLSASLKCVIDMLVKQSNGMPAEAKQVELAWKAFDDAQWDFFELMEEEEDEAAAEDMEASYEKLMGKAVAIAKAARKNVEDEEQADLKESTMQFDVIKEKPEVKKSTTEDDVVKEKLVKQDQLRNSTTQVDVIKVRLEEQESAMQVDVIKEKPADSEQTVIKAGEELQKCDGSFPHEPGADVEISKVKEKLAKAEESGEIKADGVESSP